VRPRAVTAAAEVRLVMDSRCCITSAHLHHLQLICFGSQRCAPRRGRGMTMDFLERKA
jgi:hypothetical protein